MTKLSCFQLYPRLLGAALCGALTTFAFAPYEIWWLAILSPCLLFALLEGTRVKHSLLIGYAWGLGFFGVGIRWVHISIDTFGGLPKIVSLLLMGLLVGYLAIYHALFAGLLNRFFIRSQTARWLLAAPVIWLLSEWLRGWIMTGFPWLWLGYSQLASPLSAFAPLAGVELVSGLVIFCSGALYLCWYRKSIQPLLGLILVFALGFMLNRVEWVTPQPDRSAQVALIQGNVSQAMKWLPHQRWPTIMKYTDLSRENWNADLIIWPEAAIPAFESEISNFLHNMDQAARLNHTAIITGVLTQTQDKRFYNSILTLGNNLEPEYRYQPEQRYHKHHLLPFGEFVPFAQLLRPLAPLFNLPMSSFSPGAFIQPNLTANGFTLVPALCYEIAFNEQLRSNTHTDSDFILTLSNDAWFGDSIGPWQHMEIARMRALELGKPLIRATNNGVTAVTDHNGNIVAQLPQFTTGVLKAQLTPTRGQTPYQKYGSYPLYILLLICLAAAIGLNRRFSTTWL